MRITKVMRAKGNHFDIKNYQILTNKEMCGVQSGEFVYGYKSFVLKSQQCVADHFTPVLINKSTCTYSHDTVASFFFHSTQPPPPLPTPQHGHDTKRSLSSYIHMNPNKCVTVVLVYM